MNCCFSLPFSFYRTSVRWYLDIALLVGMGLAIAPVWAQQQDWPEPIRTFPQRAQRGTLLVTAPPEVQIDGKAERLAPGARIWGVNRMLVLSASLVGQAPVVVNYVREPMGLIHEVWILNPSEARQELPKKS